MKKLLQALAVVCLLAMSAAAQSAVYGNLTAAGTDCTTAGACVDLPLSSNTGTVGVDISGTFNETVVFEVSFDNKTTYRSISVTPVASTTTVTSTTSGGAWRAAVSGATNFRVRCSVRASGTAVVSINSSTTAASISGGSGGTPGGNNTDIQFNNAGVFGGVAGDAGAANNFITGISSAGITKAQPSYANISGKPTITGTSNIVQKGNGAGGTADSSITDDGTNVSTTEGLILPAGTKTATALSFLGDTVNTGFFRNGSFDIGLSFNGSTYYRFNLGDILINSSQPSNGRIGWANGDVSTTSADLFLMRSAAATLQLGAADLNGTPVNQALRSQGAITGTDKPGGQLNIYAGPGTGAGATSQVSLSRALMLGTGTTTQSTANAVTVCESKTLSNTSATTTTLATIGLASNAGGGASGMITLVASDGTNFDAETQSFNVSFVNKATVITVGTPAITTSTAANNSGSATIGLTVTGASPTISLKVTPVFGTIVPTTVTAYITVFNQGAGAVACQ